ncbi:hypothetical protein XW60_04450 [Mycobacteroides abscessus subsp. bolletii]|nr:hypothetical protein [Mycobacteroides abscessus]ORA22087.1 hypothetical protein BST18_24705 [Mycobacteroides abscessus subsp. bolletii]TPF69884.1 hypothetical protein XW60_04450 [Mycobacteroides abscessus subsp. bolletii]
MCGALNHVTNRLNNPFGDDLAEEPFESVFASLNPVVRGALDGFRELAEMFGAGPRATAQAVATNLEHARSDGEVAITSLLAGADAIFEGCSASFASVGTGLNAQIEAIESAWDAYGHNGYWKQPVRRTVSCSRALEVLIGISDPRSIAGQERITLDSTRSAICQAITIATSLASTSHNMFGELLANMLPVGELMDSVDVAAVDHAKAFADLHKTLAAGMQKLADAVGNSVDAYRQTGLWRAPTVTIAN